MPAFRFWLYLVRADAIGVLFSIIGVALYLWKSKLWFCSIPFFGLAIFCKYTLIAAPLAVLAHLILNRQGKRGLGFAMALGLLCSLAFAVLQVTTGGWFAFHMFSTHPDRYSLAQFVALGALVWGSAPVVTVLAMWYAAHDFRSRSWTFPSSYFVMSLVTAFSRQTGINDKPFSGMDGGVLHVRRARLFRTNAKICQQSCACYCPAERLASRWSDRTESYELTLPRIR